jgi:prepilin-type N-terminal cleavage/methylation domain-containing protein
MQNNPVRFPDPPRNPIFRRGFTLVELLVVITMVAVLAVMVAGVSLKIREKAKRATATSALRQTAIANVGYSVENFGNINTVRYVGDPVEGDTVGNPNDGYASNSFWGRTQPYLFNGINWSTEGELGTALKLQLADFFGSTDVDKMTKTIVGGTPIYHDGSGLPVPFSFNRAMFPWGRFAKASTFGDPAQVLWATYGFGGFSGPDGQAYVPLPAAGSTPTIKIYYFDNKKALGAFLDGHVEEISPPMSRLRFE